MYSYGRYIVHLENMKQEIINDFSDEENVIYCSFAQTHDKQNMLESLQDYPELIEKFLSLPPAKRRKSLDKESNPDLWVALSVAAILSLERGIVLMQLLESDPIIPDGAYREMPGKTLLWLNKLYRNLSNIDI